jgi:4-deoxy-L-threo-5-hexosulose-uronate ketol-isomerase
MEVRYLPNEQTYHQMTTEDLRKAFVVEDLFIPGAVNTIYCDADRVILGGACPEKSSLKLEATKKEMAAEYFTERREIGIVNIGSAGKVKVEGTVWPLAPNDMLYVGRGNKSVEFSSDDPKKPAAFYFVSYPAHHEYPDSLAKAGAAETSHLGTPEGANQRDLHKYIHGGGVKSCQLVMGMTELATGSVWNTMPAHTHMRRTEVYLYYNLNPDSLVVHLMGKPNESRSLILRNQQAVISPSWSIHCGAGTSNYSFVWAMGGENQEFSDMDPVTMQQLR